MEAGRSFRDNLNLRLLRSLPEERKEVAQLLKADGRYKRLLFVRKQNQLQLPHPSICSATTSQTDATKSCALDLQRPLCVSGSFWKMHFKGKITHLLCSVGLCSASVPVTHPANTDSEWTSCKMFWLNRFSCYFTSAKLFLIILKHRNDSNQTDWNQTVGRVSEFDALNLYSKNWSWFELNRDIFLCFSLTKSLWKRHILFSVKPGYCTLGGDLLKSNTEDGAWGESFSLSLPLCPITCSECGTTAASHPSLEPRRRCTVPFFLRVQLA